MRSMSAFGPKRTSAGALHMSAFGGKADIGWRRVNVREWPTRHARITKFASTSDFVLLFVVSPLTLFVGLRGARKGSLLRRQEGGRLLQPELRHCGCDGTFSSV